MTKHDLLAATGISNVHKVSENTTVLEFRTGGARPATDVEKRLLAILLNPR